MQAIMTPHAPAALGPYSQAVMKNNMLFISGQLGTDPITNKLHEGFKEQAEQVFANLISILDAAGMACSHVVKVSVFLSDMSNFPVLNDIYGQHFCVPYPARETIQVARLPLNAKVEISLIAMK